MSSHLDNAAACMADPEALDFFRASALELFANQEGAGFTSKASAAAVAGASKSLALSLAKSTTPEVLWCNSGTEAVVAAVEAASSIRSGTIIVGDVEHASLAKAMERAGENPSKKLLKAKIKADGQLDLKHLEPMLDGGLALLAVHHVHAETGAVQDLKALRALLDAKAPKALLLADTTQAALKLEIPWEAARLDFAMVSGAKIGAPCGAALLYREDSKRLLGRRLAAMRSTEHRIGRCQPAVCATLAFQAKALAESLEFRYNETSLVNASFRSAIAERLGARVRFTLPPELSSPYILHMTAPGTQGATIVRMLSEKGYAISSGSACEAESKSPSRTLLAMGIPRSEAYSALRVSFWRGVSASDAVPFAEALKSCLDAY